MSGIRFEVLGVPQPKGSTKAFMPKGARFPVVTEDNANTRPWTSAVAAEARIAMGQREPFSGPVEVAVVFWLPRPQSAPKRVTEPSKKPDLDKLLRALFDGMTAGGVWADDARVVQVSARKSFQFKGELPRAEVRVTPFPEATR